MHECVAGESELTLFPPLKSKEILNNAAICSIRISKIIKENNINSRMVCRKPVSVKDIIAQNFTNWFIVIIILWNILTFTRPMKVIPSSCTCSIKRYTMNIYTVYTWRISQNLPPEWLQNGVMAFISCERLIQMNYCERRDAAHQQSHDCRWSFWVLANNATGQHTDWVEFFHDLVILQGSNTVFSFPTDWPLNLKESV